MITETDFLLAFITLLTSTLTAIVGMGGGMVLIGILPSFLPPLALIPVHGVVQLTSNASRFLFSFHAIRWSLVPAFVIGSLGGVMVFGFFVYTLPTQFIPIAIGSFILISVWFSRLTLLMNKLENYYVLGFLQSGLGLIVGATGPLGANQLRKDLTDKDEIVATAALFMSFSHIVKLLVFGMIGFQFRAYLPTMGVMIVGAILGSFIGTRLRSRIPNQWLISF